MQGECILELIVHLHFMKRVGLIWKSLKSLSSACSSTHLEVCALKQILLKPEGKVLPSARS
jgi:hypothetical protein